MARGPIEKPKLRKREIFVALAAGLLAAGGAAIALEDGIELDVVGPGDAAALVGQADTEMTYDLADFTEISTAGSQDVIITLGDEFSVRSEGSPQALALLEVEVENGRLSISPDDDFNWNRGLQLQSATFHVTLPNLSFIALAGSGDVSVDRIVGESFSTTIARSGTLTIGSMEVDEVDLSIVGSGDIIASGTARETRIAIGGSGEIMAPGLRSEEALVRIGGSGDVALGVSEDASISIAGSGDVDITGTDNCSLTRVGSGEVRCNGQLVSAN